MNERVPDDVGAWTRAAGLLGAGLASLGIPLSRVDQGRLVDYLKLLAKWNRYYNLTAVTEPVAMVVRHLLDSLAALPRVAGPRVVDVGTGAGLPGVPLAVARPDWSFVLLDSNLKKTRFVTQVVAELGLGNVRVVNDRTEAYQPTACFDTVITRAYAPLERWLREAGPLGCPDGLFLALKGRYPAAELVGLPAGFQTVGVERMDVPGLEEERHLVVLRRVARDGREGV